MTTEQAAHIIDTMPADTTLTQALTRLQEIATHAHQWQPVTWENSGKVFMHVMDGTYEYSDDGLQYRAKELMR